MKKVKYLIVGAGISGLTFANYVDDDYLIIEKESEVGGYSRTIKRNGYVWDYAGHFFHFKTDEFKKKFLDKVDKNDIVYNEKNTKILYKGRFIDFPFQMNIHELEKNEFIDCLYDLFNKDEKEKYDNFLDMLYGKFGKSITEKFLRPYNEKLYATDLTNLDVDAMGRFFPYADKEAIINNMKKKKVESYNNTFLYPKNGAGSFIKILYDTLDKDKVILNTSVNDINVKEHIATLSNNEKIEYEYLINTMPLNRFLELIGGYEKLVDEMSYNKVLVFNLGFDKPSPLCTKEHWIYIPSKEDNYYRVGFYNNILNTKKDNVSDKEIDKQLSLTLKNLEKDGIISSDMKLVDYSTIVIDPAYVHINGDTVKHLDKVKEKLGNDKIYTIGRYGAWIYNSMEDSMVSAKELAEKIK